MKRLSFIRWFFFGLVVIFVGTLWQGTPTTYAAGASIVPDPSTAVVVNGMYQDSHVTLAGYVPGVGGFETILISDQSYLRAGWTIRVDSELMYIRSLTEGGTGQPDTMLVYRGWGTPMNEHVSTTVVYAHVATVDIMAQNVSAPNYGLGAFEVDLTFPSDVQIVKLTYDSAWLTSTGRGSDCNPAYEKSPGVWDVGCASLNHPRYGDPDWYPVGAQGSGRIARVTLVPNTSGIATVSLAGSVLADVTGHDLGATLTNLKVKIVDCPDVNLDRWVDVTDQMIIAMNSNETGVDSGATLASDISSTTLTQVPISDQSKLYVGDTISVDAEQMTVQQLPPGTPNLMIVVRGANSTHKATHKAGAQIYRALVDGNGDGKLGYTRTRDVTHDGSIDVGDAMMVAMFAGTSGMQCPSP